MTHMTDRLTPGVINEAAKSVFTTGACHGLAVAVHDETYWPIVAVTDHHNVDESGCAGIGSAMHYMLRLPDGRLLDIDGVTTQERVLDEYHDYADDNYAALGVIHRDDVFEWWEEAGEPVDWNVVVSFVAPLVALAEKELS